MIEQSQDASDDPQQPELPKGPPPQFTLRQLFLLTALVAVVCSLASFVGWVWIAIALAPAAGAFLGALACPWVGLDYVLDNIQADVFRCLALGIYTAVLGRVTIGIAGLLAICLVPVAGLWAVLVSLACFGGFLFSLIMLVRRLWPLADKGEIVVVAGTAIFAAMIAIVYLPLQLIRF